MRLASCTNIVTGKNSDIPRAKPFKYTYEKEIVMYAYHKKLDYFATECVSFPTQLSKFPKKLFFSNKENRSILQTPIEGMQESSLKI